VKGFWGSPVKFAELLFCEKFNSSTICRSYPGEMGIALHCREFHWAQRDRLGKKGSG